MGGSVMTGFVSFQKKKEINDEGGVTVSGGKQRKGDLVIILDEA